MRQNKNFFIVATLIYLGFLGFWVALWQKNLQGDSDAAELFSATYGLMALFGGLVGLKVSRKWGGFKSLIGRSVIFISLGLLAQEVGQITYSMYTYLLNQEIPYPSLGDIGYFASVIFYILAAFSLIKALSAKATRKTKRNRTLVVFVPVVLLTVSYVVFLRGHSYDFSNPVAAILDFGYPMGQAFYISLALSAYLVSKKYLGGMMKPVISFLIFALVLQYAADFTFLYQVSRDTWQTAGINELMYLTAYYVMTLALLSFGSVFNKISGNGGGSK